MPELRALDRRGRWGLGCLAALTVLAAGADLIASDLPLAARVDGRLYLLPCLTHPAGLIDDDNQTLEGRASWLLAPPIPYGPYASRPGGTFQPYAPPSRAHLLGTDDRGRDVAARLLHGTRTTLVIGPLAVAGTLVLGILIGLGCAVHRRLDWVLSRVIEIGLTFPVFFLLLALQGAWGASSLAEVALAIALARWPDVARLTRIEALRIARSPHVEAARALGAGSWRVAWRHVLPLALGPALTAAAWGMGQAVLFETGLSFLGCGVPPPLASWGELLSQAQASGLALHLVVTPSLAIAVTILACNQVADGVRRVLDPTLRG